MSTSETSNRPDKKRAKEWEKTRSNTQINIHRSTINGTVRGITNGVYGPMSGGVFDVKLAPKRSNQKENNDKVPKRVKINDATPQREQDNKKIRKRTKIIYSWGDVIDKIDFRNISKKDWIFEKYNLSNEFRDFQKMTIQQVKENPYLCYKEDIQKILCLSNIMLIERIKPTYLSCDLASWNTICRRKTSSYLSSTVNNVVLEYSLLLNSFTPLEEMEDKWCENFSRVTELDKGDRAIFCKCQIILRNLSVAHDQFDANIFYSFLLDSINKDNEDTFVHNTLHNLISEIFRDPMLELVWTILVADVCVPIEREKIVGLVPVLEAFYNVKKFITLRFLNITYNFYI
ncbi:hypothetical protein C1646_677922 [Rhizophagus diaphanus]|nr:hypothetical protein C1646_677922 [Rhizophagus diaphanus] [Rhizophagus sp. MUCL 43196]